MHGISHAGRWAVAVSFAAIASMAFLLTSAATTRAPAGLIFQQSPRTIPIGLIRRVEVRMTPEEVYSIMGLSDGFFFSFSREEYYGEWTIEYFLNDNSELRVGSVRSDRTGELLVPSGFLAVLEPK